jgi:hypothetical protein
MSETMKERWMRQPHFTCPRCDATSWNPNDLREHYCGRCRLFFAPPGISLRDGAPRDPVGVSKARKRAEEALRPNPHERVREDDTSNPFPSFSSDPAPPTAPDPPASIEPGGGSSGGGGASGDW